MPPQYGVSINETSAGTIAWFTTARHAHVFRKAMDQIQPSRFHSVLDLVNWRILHPDGREEPMSS